MTYLLNVFIYVCLYCYQNKKNLSKQKQTKSIRCWHYASALLRQKFELSNNKYKAFRYSYKDKF